MLLSNICLNLVNFFYSIKKILLLLENFISNPIKNINNNLIYDEKSSNRKLNKNQNNYKHKKKQKMEDNWEILL